MTAQALQVISASGLNAALAAAGAQDTVEGAGSDRVFLLVNNGGGGSINVTIAAVRASVAVPGVGNVAVPDIVVAVPASEERMIGPINSAYTDADGTITIDYSDNTSVTVAALKLGKAT